MTFTFSLPFCESLRPEYLFFKRYKGEETLLHSWHAFITIDTIESQAVLNSTDFVRQTGPMAFG